MLKSHTSDQPLKNNLSETTVKAVKIRSRPYGTKEGVKKSATMLKDDVKRNTKRRKEGTSVNMTK